MGKGIKKCVDEMIEVAELKRDIKDMIDRISSRATILETQFMLGQLKTDEDLKRLSEIAYQMWDLVDDIENPEDRRSCADCKHVFTKVQDKPCSTCFEADPFHPNWEYADIIIGADEPYETKICAR